ncbi:hypothetical protein [Streptomyces exfoliatus]|uniref:hypothetical protein n=1 Tax=Streptomyces exfoliatus TaxID=1905 RepID=UPI003C2AD4AD
MRCTTWTSERMPVSYGHYHLQGDEFLSEYDDTDTVGRIFAGNGLKRAPGTSPRRGADTASACRYAAATKGTHMKARPLLRKSTS